MLCLRCAALAALLLLLVVVAPKAARADDDDYDVDDDDVFFEDDSWSRTSGAGRIPDCNVDLLRGKDWDAELVRCYLGQKQGASCPPECQSIYTQVGKKCIEELLAVGWGEADGDDVDEMAVLTTLVKNCASA